MTRAFNMDCMEAMKQFPDKYFDLAVVDPPYGGVFTENGGCKGWFAKYHESEDEIIGWNSAPQKEYFDELARVSKNQVIWGGNYFGLPPTRCFLIWRKLNIPLEGFTMSPVEYAWTSFNDNAQMLEAYSNGGSGREKRFHPTQKPIELYRWIFNRYAKPGDKILDTHLGSGSSRIAAYNAGLDFTGYEIDETYFQLEEERFDRHASQMNLFIDTEVIPMQK